MSSKRRNPCAARISGPNRGPGKGHGMREGPTVMPPSPELEQKILASRARFDSGKDLPESATADLLDARAFHYIASRDEGPHLHLGT